MMLASHKLNPKNKNKVKKNTEKRRSHSKEKVPIDIDSLLPSPQPGGQQRFAESEADIAIFGGAAGCGKSYALLASAVKHIGTPGYGAVIFRRTSPEITAEGGLWDESIKYYSAIPGARSRESDGDWIFPNQSAVSFGHCQYEKDVFDKYPGTQICHLYFDELTKFTAKQFWFLFSRNRSTCGIPPKIKASCNPDASSWVRDLIDWWIDKTTGFAIKERSGILRYFYRVEGKLYWGDSKEELEELFPALAEVAPPKSLTFIPGTIYENKALLDANPEYLATLLSLLPVDRDRLLYGNWNVKQDIEGLLMQYFKEPDHIGVPPAFNPLKPLGVSFDFNRNPAVALITQRQGDLLCIYEEVYLNNADTFKSAAIVRSRVDSYNPYILNLYGDASGKAMTANSQQSNWDIVHNALVGIPWSRDYELANPPIVDTVNSCNNAFIQNNVVIHPNCRELIRDLATVRWDKSGGGIDKSDPARTHLLDAFRYAVHREMPYR